MDIACSPRVNSEVPPTPVNTCLEKCPLFATPQHKMQRRLQGDTLLKSTTIQELKILFNNNSFSCLESGQIYMFYELRKFCDHNPQEALISYQ